MNNHRSLELLRRGILEIRALSSSGVSDNREQIHTLANILHNLPSALQGMGSLDEAMLVAELSKYEERYGKSGVGLLDSIIGA